MTVEFYEALVGNNNKGETASWSLANTKTLCETGEERKGPAQDVHFAILAHTGLFSPSLFNMFFVFFIGFSLKQALKKDRNPLKKGTLLKRP